MTLAFAAGVLGAMALPHSLPLDRAAPKAAVALWTAALALRALVGVLMVLVVVLIAPTTDVFQAMTHWCWHAVLPLLATHLGVSGHMLGDTATLLPGFTILASLLSMVWGLTRAAHAVRKMIRKEALGAGPLGSLIVGGADVAVAAAGLARPHIVISAGALVLLDDAELRAGIEHERGHVSGRHRFILILGQACRALGSLIPGSDAALRELAFHLERDADQYALARTSDPSALARAISKSAGGLPSTATLISLSGGTTIRRRLRLLDPEAQLPFLQRRAPGCLAVLMALLALAVATTVPGVTVAGSQALSVVSTPTQCPS